MLVLKIYTTSARVPQIVKVLKFPCTIGRGVKNDVILDDNGVSAEHCIIEGTDHGFIIRDLNSRNGLLLKGIKQKEIKLTDNLEIMLGNTKIVVLLEEWDSDATHEIDYNLLLDRRAHWGWLKSLALFTAEILGIFLVLSLSFHIDYGTNHKVSKFISEGLTYVAWAIVLSGVIASFAKLQTKRYHFGRVLSVINLAVVIFSLYSALADTIFFNLGDNISRDIFAIGFGFSFLFWLLYQLGRIIFPSQSLRRLKIITSAGVTSLFVLSWLIGYLASFDSLKHEYEAPMGYPLLKISASQSVETLLKAINESQKTVDKYQRDELKDLEEKQKNTPNL